MGIGADSPAWRKLLFRAGKKIYIRRQLTTDDGAANIFVSPGSSLKVLKPKLQIEAPHKRFIRDWIKPDSIVWDIGANMGLFAFPAGLRASAGALYAFEPDIELANNLIRNSRLNRHIAITPICAAVSDTDGTAAFEVSRYSCALNKLANSGRWNRVEASEMRQVPTLKVDTLVVDLKPPTIMKIDVEGAEMRVLEGASRTIESHRPVIMIEGPDELKEDMKRFFSERDYVLVDGSNDSYELLEFPVWDTFAIPGETYPRIANLKSNHNSADSS